MVRNYAGKMKDLEESLVTLINTEWETQRADLAPPLGTLTRKPAVLDYGAPEALPCSIHVFPGHGPLRLTSGTHLKSYAWTIPGQIVVRQVDWTRLAALTRDLQGLVADAVLGDPTLGGKCLGPADGADLVTFQPPVHDEARSWVIGDFTVTVTKHVSG